MNTFNKDFTAVIPFREINLPPLGSLASNVLLFSLTVIAILFVPVCRQSTASSDTTASTCLCPLNTCFGFADQIILLSSPSTRVSHAR